MDLDWEPLPTPKRGYEDEFVDVFKKLIGATGSKRQTLSARFESISEPAFATLGAPRVGYDEAADRWLVERLEKRGRSEELDEMRVEMLGYNVLDLLPPCDGFSVYSNHPISDTLDRTSFHAQLLVDCRAILGDELLERAFTMMLPEQHLAYGDALWTCAMQYATERRFEHVDTIREPVFPEGS